MVSPGPEQTSRLARAASLIAEGEAAGYHLEASADGQLARREKALSFNFGFNFRERPFSARAVTEGDTLRLSFFGEFGVLPFSQEDRGRRQEILDLLPQLKAAGLSWELTRTQALRVGAALELKGVTAPREILAAVIEYLVLSRASLDAISALAYVPPKPALRSARRALS